LGFERPEGKMRGAVQQPNVRPKSKTRRLRYAAGSLLALAMLVAWREAAATEPKRVVLLHSFGQNFKPWSEYAKAIRSELQRQSPWQLDITDQSLVTARSSNEDPEVAFVAYLRALFTNAPPDLIVSIGAPAARFVQRHRPQLFPETPMVLTAVDERRVQTSLLSTNDAAVPVWIDYLAAIENILRVLPETENVMVVVGTSPIEQFWKEEIDSSVMSLKSRVSFAFTDSLSFDDVLERAAALPSNSAIFWELMIVDALGIVHEGNTAIARLHERSNAPIFSYDESFFGREIVGGPLLAVLDSSQQTATVGLRILGGEKASDIKIPSVKFSTPKFDWREMQRWGISESRLPPGSEIHFREPTAWQRYRWELTAIIATLLLQMSMIAWLLVERHRRQRAEQQSRSRLLELVHLNRSAAVGAMSASFAHELGQPLGGIALHASAAMRLFDKDTRNDGQLREALADIQKSSGRAMEIMQHMRDLLNRRDSVKPQLFDVNAVLADVSYILTAEAQKRRVELNTNCSNERLWVRADPVQIQQVMLNLVLNGMDAMQGNQSGARVMTVDTALFANAHVEMSVSDNGKGIPGDDLGKVFEAFYTTKPQGTGLGLSIARQIVESYGGKIWAENRPGGGTTFRFRLPLAHSP
jgi:signal transduction histidine kinase